jgi:hypothetical protein
MEWSFMMGLKKIVFRLASPIIANGDEAVLPYEVD